MAASYTAADKKGSLTSEDLVGSLAAVVCDFDAALPLLAAAELASAAEAGPGGAAAGGAMAAGGKEPSKTGGKKSAGLTPGQRVFYEKILKPRKPGAEPACRWGDVARAAAWRAFTRCGRQACDVVGGSGRHTRDDGVDARHAGKY